LNWAHPTVISKNSPERRAPSKRTLTSALSPRFRPPQEEDPELREVDRSGLKSLNVLADYLTICMPKPSYTCITVPVRFYTALKSEASRIGCSIPEFIRQALSTSTFEESTSTSIRSTSTNGREKTRNPASFAERSGPGGIRTHDRQLRRLPRYPSCTPHLQMQRGVLRYGPTTFSHVCLSLKPFFRY
jgi:hypothetical protein